MALLASTSLQAAQTKIGVHTFTHGDEYQVELVAGSPLVDRPIVADFDDEGRLYVPDSSGSNDPVQKQLEQKPHRIMRLEDADNDGKFDKSVVFADKMMFPEGSMWHAGALYVSAPPSIWKLTDTNNDGVADKREEWVDAKTLTGCANDLHGPYLGLDGWIYWCKGAFAEQTWDQTSGAQIKSRAAHIFRRRPEGGPVDIVMTGGMDNPVDVTFTPEGERFFTTTFFQHPGGGQRDGIIHAIYGGVYGKIHDVIDGHKRTGEVMPVLTHLGPAAPSGLVRLLSDPSGRTLLAANFNLHKVSKHRLVEQGASYRTEDSDFLVSDQTDFHPTDVIEDADGSVLVIDTGGWYKICCPTSQLSKPDVLGAIYRVSRKGQKVEDPRGQKLKWDLSPITLAHRLADARPAVRKRTADALVAMGPEGLAAISEANGQVTLRKRETVRLKALREAEVRPGKDVDVQTEYIWAATRIPTKDARVFVRGFLTGPATTGARHAALNSISLWRDTGAYPRVALTLQDRDPQMRRAAAEALGRLGNKAAVSSLLKAAETLDAKSVDRVLEHSLIYALIELNDPANTVHGLASAHPAVQRTALMALDQMDRSNLAVAQVLPFLSSKEALVRDGAQWVLSHHSEWGKALLPYFEEQLGKGLSDDRSRQMEELIGAFGGNGEVQKWLAEQVTTGGPAAAKPLLLRVMARSGVKEVPAAWVDALIASLKEKQLSATAIRSIRALPVGNNPGLATALTALGNDDAEPSIRSEALAAIPGGLQEVSSDVFAFLIESLAPKTSSEVRTASAAAIAKARLSEEQLLALAGALKTVGPVELPRLLPAFEKSGHSNVGRKALAELQGSGAIRWIGEEQLAKTFAKYPEEVKSDLKKAIHAGAEDTLKQREQLDTLLAELNGGDIRRGQAIFNSAKAACSTCHAIGYLGGDLGPDLTRIGQIRTERDLLEAVIYPSASFVRSYEPIIVTTNEDDQVSGVLKRDAADEVVLATGPGAVTRVPRADVVSMRPGSVSVMPQGLDQQLSKEELADLLAFLKATRW